jgi:hypothetical protein
MDIIYRHSTLTKKRKNVFNVSLRKKNDSDINFEKVSSKIFGISKKYFKKRIFSKRLLFLNIDWNQLNSTDIYAFLLPFVSTNGKILSVSVVSLDKINNKINLDLKLSNFQNFSISNNTRFCLVTCDSIKTAKSIYKICNGLEIISTNIWLDIRFVPSFCFSWLKIIDFTDKLPDNYFPKFLLNKKKNTSTHLNKLKNINSKQIEVKHNDFSNSTKKKDLDEFERRKLINQTFKKFFKKHSIILDQKINDISSFFIKDIEFFNKYDNKFKNTDML